MVESLLGEGVLSHAIANPTVVQLPFLLVPVSTVRQGFSIHLHSTVQQTAGWSLVVLSGVDFRFFFFFIFIYFKKKV